MSVNKFCSDCSAKQGLVISLYIIHYQCIK